MVSYKVNREARTVKCTLVDFCNGKVRKSVGVARCAPEDEFNEEIGKNIAFHRARIDEIGKNIGFYTECKRRLKAQYDAYNEALDARIARQREEICRLHHVQFEALK